MIDPITLEFETLRHGFDITDPNGSQLGTIQRDEFGLSGEAWQFIPCNLCYARAPARRSYQAAMNDALAHAYLLAAEALDA